MIFGRKKHPSQMEDHRLADESVSFEADDLGDEIIELEDILEVGEDQSPAEDLFEVREDRFEAEFEARFKELDAAAQRPMDFLSDEQTSEAELLFDDNQDHEPDFMDEDTRSVVELDAREDAGPVLEEQYDLEQILRDDSPEKLINELMVSENVPDTEDDDSILKELLASDKEVLFADEEDQDLVAAREGVEEVVDFGEIETEAATIEAIYEEDASLQELAGGPLAEDEPVSGQAPLTAALGRNLEEAAGSDQVPDDGAVKEVGLDVAWGPKDLLTPTFEAAAEAEFSAAQGDQRLAEDGPVVEGVPLSASLDLDHVEPLGPDQVPDDHDMKDAGLDGAWSLGELQTPIAEALGELEISPDQGDQLWGEGGPFAEEVPLTASLDLDVGQPAGSDQVPDAGALKDVGLEVAWGPKDLQAPVSEAVAREEATPHRGDRGDVGQVDGPVDRSTTHLDIFLPTGEAIFSIRATGPALEGLLSLEEEIILGYKQQPFEESAGPASGAESAGAEAPALAVMQEAVELAELDRFLEESELALDTFMPVEEAGAAIESAECSLLDLMARMEVKIMSDLQCLIDSNLHDVVRVVIQEELMSLGQCFQQTDQCQDLRP